MLRNIFKKRGFQALLRGKWLLLAVLPFFLVGVNLEERKWIEPLSWAQIYKNLGMNRELLKREPDFYNTIVTLKLGADMDKLQVLNKMPEQDPRFIEPLITLLSETQNVSIQLVILKKLEPFKTDRVFQAFLGVFDENRLVRRVSTTEEFVQVVRQILEEDLNFWRLVRIGLDQPESLSSYAGGLINLFSESYAELPAQDIQRFEIFFRNLERNQKLVERYIEALLAEWFTGRKTARPPFAALGFPADAFQRLMDDFFLKVSFKYRQDPLFHNFIIRLEESKKYKLAEESARLLFALRPDDPMLRDLFFEAYEADPTKLYLLTYLTQMKDPRIIPFLAQHLREIGPDERKEVVTGLGEFTLSENLEEILLNVLIHDPISEVRMAAAGSLVKLQSERAREYLDYVARLDRSAEVRDQVLFTALPVVPDLVDEGIKRALEWVSSGQQKKAMALYEKMMEVAPENQEIPVHLAEAYLSVGEKESAGMAYRRALEIDPDQRQVRDKLASLYYDLGKTALKEGNQEDALKAFSQAVEVRPDFTEVLLKGAEIYVTRGQEEQAIRWVWQAIERGQVELATLTESEKLKGLLEHPIYKELTGGDRRIQMVRSAVEEFWKLMRQKKYSDAEQYIAGATLKNLEGSLQELFDPVLEGVETIDVAREGVHIVGNAGEVPVSLHFQAKSDLKGWTEVMLEDGKWKIKEFFRAK